MNRKVFKDLLKRYLSGNCSDEERALIDQWYELLDDELPVDMNSAELKKVESRLWSKIRNQVTVPVTSNSAEQFSYKTPIRRLWVKWAAVAAVVGIVVAGVYFYNRDNAAIPAVSLLNKKVREGLLEEINNTDSVKLILLEDGSSVALQPLAKIAFPRHFLTDKRELYLEGDAFFTVSKNAARPFFVYNGSLVTQVLGTSFYVRTIKNKIEVSVKTGKVAVYENGQQISLNEQQKKTNGVIITPNQKVSYYTENRHFITSLVDAPVPVPAENNSLPKINFVFDDAPFAEVISSLEKTYDIEMVLENEQLKNCPFTGDITQQSLFNKLEFICQVFEATYEIRSTKILIKGGKGCPDK